MQTVYPWSPTLETYPSEFSEITKFFRYKFGFIFPIFLFILIINSIFNFISKYIEIIFCITYFLMSYEYFELGKTNNEFNFKFYVLRQIINFACCSYSMVYLIMNIKKSETIYICPFLIPLLIHELYVIFCFANYIKNRCNTYVSM
jgi:hypothetical protein